MKSIWRWLGRRRTAATSPPTGPVPAAKDVVLDLELAPEPAAVRETQSSAPVKALLATPAEPSSVPPPPVSPLVAPARKEVVLDIEPAPLPAPLQERQPAPTPKKLPAANLVPSAVPNPPVPATAPKEMVLGLEPVPLPETQRGLTPEVPPATPGARFAPTATPVSPPPKEVVLDAEPPPPTAPTRDAEEAKAVALARLSYFAPAGYSPYGGRPPKLLAPANSAIPGTSAAHTTTGARSYFLPPEGAASPRTTAPPGVLSAVDPASLSLYLLCREDDPRLDLALTERCLREPEALARAIKLRNEAIDNWLAGRAPWNLAQLYARALALAGHAGTALLLCHNVTRAFARGGRAIRWINADRHKGEYFDGARTFAAHVLHPQGVLRAGPFAAPSLFYLLFSAHVFGAADPGDWRRYFASAALAWYAASNAVTPTPALSGFGAQWAAQLESTRARGWQYANAAALLELAAFGRSAADNSRVGRVHFSGASFGLAQASAAPPADAHAAESLDGPAQPAPRAIDESLLSALHRALPPNWSGRAPIQAICTIEEGIACRFAFSDWSHPALDSAESLADAIGWNLLDHAARRQAAIRFWPPSDAVGKYSCEIDLGEGYKPWEVS